MFSDTKSAMASDSKDDEDWKKADLTDGTSLLLIRSSVAGYVAAGAGTSAGSRESADDDVDGPSLSFILVVLEDDERNAAMVKGANFMITSSRISKLCV